MPQSRLDVDNDSVQVWRVIAAHSSREGFVFLHFGLLPIALKALRVLPSRAHNKYRFPPTAQRCVGEGLEKSHAPILGTLCTDCIHFICRPGCIREMNGVNKSNLICLFHAIHVIHFINVLHVIAG